LIRERRPFWRRAQGRARCQGSRNVRRDQIRTTRRNPCFAYSRIRSSRVASVTPCMRAVAIRKRSAGARRAESGRASSPAQHPQGPVPRPAAGLLAVNAIVVVAPNTRGAGRVL
jgi:hypothetical protein